MKYYNAPRLIIIIEPWQTKCLLTFDAFDIIIELPSVLAPLLGSWLQARKARTASDTVWIPPCSTGPWQATRAAQRSSEAFHESTGLTWTVLPNAKDRLAQICPGKFFNLKKQVRVSQPELWTILYSIKSNDVRKIAWSDSYCDIKITSSLFFLSCISICFPKFSTSPIPINSSQPPMQPKSFAIEVESLAVE